MMVSNKQYYCMCLGLKSVQFFGSLADNKPSEKTVDTITTYEMAAFTALKLRGLFYEDRRENETMSVSIKYNFGDKSNEHLWDEGEELKKRIQQQLHNEKTVSQLKTFSRTAQSLWGMIPPTVEIPIILLINVILKIRCVSDPNESDILIKSVDRMEGNNLLGGERTEIRQRKTLMRMIIFLFIKVWRNWSCRQSVYHIHHLHRT